MADDTSGNETLNSAAELIGSALGKVTAQTRRSRPIIRIRSRKPRSRSWRVRPR